MSWTPLLGSPHLPKAYPLTWPDDWPRTPDRASSGYRLGFDGARKHLEGELRRADAYAYMLSTNLPVRYDGRPYATAKSPEDPGVALWWISWRDHHLSEEKEGTPAIQVLACDQWLTVRENLRAVGVALEAFRTLARSGATQIVNRAFQGFTVQTLPVLVTEPEVEEPQRPRRSKKSSWWRDILELYEEPFTRADVTRAFRRQAVRCHPDQGGTPAQWRALEQARDEAYRNVQTPAHPGL